MARFNRPYGNTLAYPASLVQILTDVCRPCDVTLATPTLLTSTYSLTERPENITCHEIVAAEAELSGA